MKRYTLVAALLLILSIAWSNVLFYDDFNRTESSAVGNSWTSIGPVTPVIESGAMKVVSNGLQGARRDFSSLGITSGIYYVSWDWKITSNNWLADAFPNGTVTYLRQDYDGLLYYDNTSDFSNPTQIGTLAMGTWANFRLKINIDTDRFSLWKDNVLIADNIAGLAVTDFTRFTFRAGSSSNVTQYIDNFIVYNEVAPATPTALAAAGTVSNIALSWTATAQQFQTYKVYRSTTAGASTLLAEVPGTQTTFTDNTAAANTDYFYRVKAVSMSTLESGFSSEVTAHLQPDIAVTPQVINVTVGQGYTGTSSFTIANNGNYPLSYSISGSTSNELTLIAGFEVMGVFNGHSYYRSSSTMTWTSAKLMCEQKGGYLATISNSAENNFIYQNTIGTSWIGLNDEVSEGLYRWANGESVTYTNWYSGQPDNSSNEDYVHIRYSTLGAQWNDHQNAYLSYAVLEFDYIHGLPSYLSVNTHFGSVLVNGQTQVEVGIDAQALLMGDYFNTIYVISNDPETVSVPVTINLTVASGIIAFAPTIFNYEFNIANNSSTTTVVLNNIGLGLLNYTVTGTDLYKPIQSIPVIDGFTALGIFNGHRYYYSNSVMSWSSAKTLCELKGGHLATITNAAENSFCSSSTRMWIGLTDQNIEGVYQWVTGEPFVYSNWGTGQPDNAGGTEDYIELNYNNVGWWNDSPNSGWNGNIKCLMEIDNATTYTSILDFTPSFGILGASTSQTITMNINGSSLSDGVTQTFIKFTSNSPEPQDTILIPVSVKVDYTPPIAPLGLTFNEAQSDMDQIRISWTANALADSVYNYRVYRRGLHDTAWTLKGTVGANQLWYIDNQFTGLDTTAVYYKITAVDWVDNEGAASAEVIAWLQRFPAPANLTINTVLDRHIHLQWTPVTQTISGIAGTPSCYIIYKSSTALPLSEYDFLDIAETAEFTHRYATFFQPSDRLFYIVTAYGGDVPGLRRRIAGRDNLKYGDIEQR